MSVAVAEADIISGERLQNIADLYIGYMFNLYENPNMRHHIAKMVELKSITEPFHNPAIIYTPGQCLQDLQRKIHLFQRPFTLLSHNSDQEITEEFIGILSSPNLKKWYAQNVCIDHPKLEIVPIGIANTMWSPGNLSMISQAIKGGATVSKDLGFYFYFNVFTNPSQRMVCKDIIERKGLTFGSGKGYSDYLTELSRYKFAINPPGNGADCHRLWECYYLGVIPVVLRSVFTEKIAQRLPVILLDKWEDFDADAILSEYDNLYRKLVGASRYLCLSYYEGLIRGCCGGVG